MVSFSIIVAYCYLYEVSQSRTPYQKEIVEKEIIKQSDPIYIYQTDTIFKEILSDPIGITKEVIKTVYKDRLNIIDTLIAINSDIKRSSDHDGLNPIGTKTELNKDEAYSPTVETSDADDAALVELLGGIK